MKFNLFNTVLPLSEKSSLIYNAYSDSFIVFNSKYEEAVQTDFPKLQAHNPRLAQLLIDTKCYIENETDEFEQLKQLSDEILSNERSYFAIINPTLACNFKCWYCYENHLPGSKMTEETKNRVFALFGNILKENQALQSFSIGFFGGEPLLYFKSIVLPIIRYHAELRKHHGLTGSIAFTSNGALITPAIISELARYENVSFQITLDGDEEAHNKVRFSGNHKGSYQTIINNVWQLLRNDIAVRIRINYTQDSIPSIKNILTDIKSMPSKIKKNLEIDFHRVWQDRDKDQRAEAEGIRETVDAFIGAGFKAIFNYRDEMFSACYGDKKNTCVVNYNGDIYKCTAKDFTSENRDGYLDENGQIVWENPQEYRRSLKLKNKPCHSCRIAPLCAGGCTRFILEHEKEMDNYCHFNYSEQRKDQLILDRFDTLIRNKQIEAIYDCETSLSDIPE